MAIETVFVGKILGWKQGVSLGKKNNQTFTQIPFNTFISQLTYKCLMRGIKVVGQEESYTSKASFLDEDEIPVYEKNNQNQKFIFSGKRISRGLYKAKDGKVLNADVNGSYNILVKGLLTLNKSLDRKNLSFHTKSLKNNLTSVSNANLLSQYM